MIKKVLVTGADGLLGSHVVRRALAEGYQVRTMLQPNHHTGTLDGLPIERVEGDITHPADLESALLGTQAVIHTAGSTALYPNRSPQMWQVNVDAVMSLADLVRKHSLERLVHIGSASSFGYGSFTHPGDETSPYLGTRFHLDYLDTKKAAQDQLLDLFREQGLPVIILAPTFLVGDYDHAPGSGKMILAVSRRSLPFYTPGGKCVVYAGDVAQAAVNALKLGRLGECYITGGANMSYRDLMTLIAQLACVPPPHLQLPTPLAIAGGWLATRSAGLTGKPPALTATMARMAADTHYYRSDKATAELQLPHTPPQIAVRRALDYYKTIGWL